MKMRVLIISFIFFTISMLSIYKYSQKNMPRYNVVFLSIDSLRADHMSLFGYQRNTTPYIDRWSKGAQVFENFHSESHMTIPSEASVFTGKYPFKNGIISYYHPFFSNIETITSILSKRGYETFAYGNSPEYKLYPEVKKSFSPFFKNYLIEDRTQDSKRSISPATIENFLDGLGSKNFFLWLPIGALHAPFGYPFKNTFSDKNYSGPLKFLEKYPAGILWLYKGILYPITYETNFFRIAFSATLGTQVARAAKSKVTLNSEDFDWITDRYDDGLVAVDSQVEEIMNVFEKRGLTKNTIFVLYSNHGEELNEHGYVGHFDLYQGNTKVPLIIKTPSISTAKQHSTLGSSIDILPTLFSMMKIAPPDDIDGIDLFSSEAQKRDSIFLLRTPLWESIVRTSNKINLWNDFRNTVALEDYMDPAIVTSQYKLIHRKSRFILKKYSLFQNISKKDIIIPEYELYDLKKDPSEQINLAGLPGDAFESLKTKLSSFEEKIKKYKPFFKKNGPLIQDYQ